MPALAPDVEQPQDPKARGRLKAVPGTCPPLFRLEELDAWINARHRR